MSEISTHAFKLFESIDQRLQRIEALMGQLVEEKELREAMMQAVVDIKQHAQAIKDALPRA